MIAIEELEKKINQGQLDSLYLLFGEETFLLESIVKKIKKLFGKLEPGINYITIDETNVKEIIPNLDTPAFGYEKKLIIVKNAGVFKKEGRKKNAESAKIKEELNEYLQKHYDIIEESAILVFIEEEAEKQALYKTIEKQGVVCEFAFQKPNQIGRRLKSICNAYKVKIEDSTIMYFIEECGTNMQDLINEIRKLIEHAGENGTITKKDIDLLCTKQIQAIIFDLTDNLGKKKIKEALQVLDNLIYRKEPVQKILINLYHHFKKLYFVKLAQESKKDVAVALNLKANQQFLVGKYKTQAGYFEKQELRQILSAFIDLDANYKVGLIDLEIGLSSILCRYCS